LLIPAHIPIQKVHFPLLEEKHVNLSIKRLDLIHPLVSGNKFFKLKYNLLEAKSRGYSKLLTFGGTYSNHIYATAAAAEIVGIPSIGVIRGEEKLPLNPTLAFAKEKGMELHYLNRTQYRVKESAAIQSELIKKFGSFFLLPEGGTNEMAIKGTAEILRKEDAEFDHITVPIGTGGTFAGLAKTILDKQKLIGFSSLKGDFIHREIGNLLQTQDIPSTENLCIIDQYHFGGYAKHNDNLIDFIMDFYKKTLLPLDVVYTGKMMYGLMDMIKNDYFTKEANILALHTGGLQGNIGFNKKFGTQLQI
jgi:1-aminocyclopropane-1-carboxylate deaminase/D-cysteine desulfhydrase-like pyridoxal-dependent ACC family enzyme